ncbi:hypothetical protein AVEN_261691-1 [Araneus ventricosus]|uniref:Uncharacterized protein n=1 Tax=Araneus ventricosus TaxID=182803 RepID=A0A4Y2DX40_ARAVE|nr:hypothetical protein AVEN_261691-1 [Araneus ventricosus]
MTRTTPEPAIPSKLLHHASGRTFDHFVLFNEQQAHIHGGYSEKTGFEPGTQPTPKAETLPLGDCTPLQLQASWHPQTTLLDPRLQILLELGHFFLN